MILAARKRRPRREGEDSHGVEDSPEGKQRRGSRTLLGAVRGKKRSWRASIAPPPPADVREYLEGFGYLATDAQSWEDLPQDEVPEGVARSGAWIALGIAEHAEKNGHTSYQIECSLAVHGSKTVDWQVGRRLQHIRKFWYDRVKVELGEAYNQHFEDAHFAHRGGRNGTSKRLHVWCSRLAACINAGQLSPAIVALTLRFLGAPSLPSGCCEDNSNSCSGSNSHCSTAAPADESDYTSCRSPRCSEDESVGRAGDGDGSDEDYESDFETDSEYSDEEHN